MTQPPRSTNLLALAVADHSALVTCSVPMASKPRATDLAGGRPAPGGSRMKRVLAFVTVAAKLAARACVPGSPRRDDRVPLRRPAAPRLRDALRRCAADH